MAHDLLSPYGERTGDGPAVASAAIAATSKIRASRTAGARRFFKLQRRDQDS
jgi:hypothetical protein